jgi:hypothetical protein
MIPAAHKIPTRWTRAQPLRSARVPNGYRSAKKGPSGAAAANLIGQVSSDLGGLWDLRGF